MSWECPVCGSPNDSGTGRGNIAFCKCGHRWLQLTDEAHREVSAAAYSRNYTGYLLDGAFEAFARKFTQTQLIPYVPPPARLLDIGCGAGSFMQIANSFGYEATGIDISPTAAEICQSQGLNASSGDFLTTAFSCRFDVITMWDVIEHLRDPRAVLHRASELLSDRGILFAKVPAFGCLSLRLSNSLPRLQGALLGAPHHVQYFSAETLKLLVERVGLQFRCEVGGHIRSQGDAPISRHVIRSIRNLLKAMSGDHNLFLIARNGSSRTAPGLERGN